MVDIFSLEVQSALSDLTDEQKSIFESTYNSKKKNKKTYVLLAIFFPIQLLLLGKFLLWVFFVGTVGGVFLWYLFEIFYTSKRVDKFNIELALRIINQIKLEVGLTESESESNEKVLDLRPTKPEDKKWVVVSCWIVVIVIVVLYISYSSDPDIVGIREEITGTIQESIGMDCDGSSVPTQEEVALIVKEIEAQCDSDLYFRKIKGFWYVGIPGQFCYSLAQASPNNPAMIELMLMSHVDVFVADGFVSWKDVVDKMNVNEGIMSTCSFMQ